VLFGVAEGAEPRLDGGQVRLVYGAVGAEALYRPGEVTVKGSSDGPTGHKKSAGGATPLDVACGKSH
jgi:hypothetical protein